MKNKRKEKNENRRQQIIMAIDYLERKCKSSYSRKESELLAEEIQKLNKSLKELNR
jgi:hypothetical protein